MVSQALIQQKVAYGLAKAASKLGAVGSQFRPTQLLGPMTAAPYATLPMQFYKDATFQMQSPAAWGKPDRYAMLDTTDIQSGDILACNGETVFVGCFEPIMPPYVVMCTTVLSVYGGTGGDGTPANSGTGSCDMSGSSDSFNGGSPVIGGAALASGWPAYIGPPKRGEKMDISTPGLLRPGEFELRLPLMPKFVLATGMVVETPEGLRYTVGAVNLSPYGQQAVLNAVQV